MATLAHSLAHPRRFSKPLILGPGVPGQNCCPLHMMGRGCGWGFRFRLLEAADGGLGRAALPVWIARFASTPTKPGKPGIFRGVVFHLN